MATTTRIGTLFGETPVLSANGQYVAYVSTNIDFSNDTNGVSDVIVQDLLTKNFSFVSVSSNETLGNRFSSLSDVPAISADGRFIVFASNATNLVPSDTNGENDLFLRDTIAGTTARISLDSNGNPSPANTDVVIYKPSISADGRFVAFQSNAQLAGIQSSATDIFVRDVVAGTTTIASVNSSGTQANSSSFSPSISADGRFVAFHSLARNLVAGDTNIDFDIFVHDRLNKTTICASVNSQEQKGSGASQNEPSSKNDALNPVMSPNGRYVVFQSSYNNLVPNDTNGVNDIFMRDLQTGTTTRISVDSAGNQANGSSAIGFQKSSISADGRYVVFQSVANNLVPGDSNNALDVFVRDIVAGTTTRVSVNSKGEEPVTGSTGTESYGGTISADGSKIVFMSNGKNMNDAGIDTPEIYLRDFGSASSSPNPGTESTGNAGNNTLTGTPGNDTLNGKGGRDVLTGGDGNDVIIGSKGNDVLTGGAGRDRFVYQKPQDRFDRITDFTVGEDKIVLSQLLDRLVPGNYRGRNAIRDDLISLVRRGADTRIDADLNGRAVSGGFKPLILIEDVNLTGLKNLRNFVF